MPKKVCWNLVNGWGSVRNCLASLAGREKALAKHSWWHNGTAMQRADVSSNLSPQDCLDSVILNGPQAKSTHPWDKGNTQWKKHRNSTKIWAEMAFCTCSSPSHGYECTSFTPRSWFCFFSVGVKCQNLLVHYARVAFVERELNLCARCWRPECKSCSAGVRGQWRRSNVLH